MDEHEIGRLLRLLPAAPAEWTQAAQELPFLSAELAGILERARGDGGFRDGCARTPAPRSSSTATTSRQAWSLT